MKTIRPQARHPAKAFTAVELLVSIAAVVLLCCLIVPVLARAKQSPQAALCLSNQRQLMQAALMYVEDNGGLWFPNQPNGANPAQKDWVTSNFNFNANNPDNTNLSLLTNPNSDFFARYIKSPQIFHCPGDQSFVLGEGRRVRSVSANHAVGTIWLSGSCYRTGDPVTGQWLTGTLNDCTAFYRCYGKTSDMVNPKPAQLFIFADEHANSINDNALAVEIAQTGFGARWIDLPAMYHNGAAGISFADGHVEMHRWVGSLANWPVSWNGSNPPPFPVIQTIADIQDISWLQQRTSALNQ